MLTTLGSDSVVNDSYGRAGVDVADPGQYGGVRPLHHGSHLALLHSVPAKAAPEAHVEAVIVPAARPTRALREAVMLARDLGSILFALCSRSAEAAEAASLAADENVRFMAMDLKSRSKLLPRLATTKLLKGTTFESRSDVSTKRNLGLVIARIMGWERVLFLDDDITGVRRAHARAAVGLLEEYQAIGLYNAGYPDHSAVCHVYREVSESQAQRQFIGAGALAVAPARTHSFFPNVYNEDWLFFLGQSQLPHLAQTGRVFQKAYDPFASADRARREEFGDSLAEGLFWLLDEGAEPKQADTEYWRDFLNRRQCFIRQLIAWVQHERKNPEQRDRRLAALEAALGRNSMISPRFCVRFLDRWRDDHETWRNFLAEFDQSVDSLDDALRRLGLADVTYRSF